MLDPSRSRPVTVAFSRKRFLAEAPNLAALPPQQLAQVQARLMDYDGKSVDTLLARIGQILKQKGQRDV